MSGWQHWGLEGAYDCPGLYLPPEAQTHFLTLPAPVPMVSEDDGSKTEQ